MERLSPRTVVCIALLSAPMLFSVGCSKSLEGIAKKDNELGADAKAVVAALAKASLSPAKVKVVDEWIEAIRASNGRQSGAVVVRDGRITHVRLVGVAVETKPLAKLTAVERIDITFGPTSRVEGLAKLPKLKRLDLRNNKITHLIGLEDLPALRELDLRDNPLKVISGIKNVGLAGLDLSKFKTLETLEKLEKLPRMIRIAAPGNKLTRFAAAKLPELMSLVLKNNKLKSLRVEELPKLQVINAQGNKLTEVTLNKLPALTHISLSDNQLKALPTLAGSKKLAKVLVVNNKIRTLAGIERLPAKELFIDNNLLTDLVATPLAQRTPEAGKRKRKAKDSAAAALPPLPRLVTLAAERNRLTSLAGVGRFVNLKYLYVNRNKLRSLAGLEKLKKLRKLGVAHNKLKSLAPLQAEKLDELIATDNQIAAAPELFGATKTTRPKIKRYDLRRNALTGVATALLFYGLATRSYRGLYVPPKRTHRGGGGYVGSRRSGGYRYRGSRYSSGGGYRSGK